MPKEDQKDFNAMLRQQRDMPRVQTVTDPGTIAKYGGSRMLLAPPLAYDAVMRAIPFGRLTTAGEIRAHLAHIGHPLLGDGKYGSEKRNRQYGRTHQALWSWSLEFRFTTPAGALEYLNGRRWQVSEVDFVQQYFPDYSLQRAAELPDF